MPSSSSFTGVGLFLQSATLINANTVLRVRFSNDPKRSNSALITDALNPSNWTLSGSISITVSSVTAVVGDSQSVDLILSQQIPVGVWTITAASTIQTIGSIAIINPKSIVFTATAVIDQSVQNENVSKVDRIFDLLPKYFNARQDENWSSLITAIGSEDDRLAKLAEEVRKQFFVKTASRPYIDRLAANSNLQRPRFVGMSDTDFRRFIPILSYQPKQVKRIIDEMLDLFFLKDATTAFLSTELYEPFVLKDSWSLDIKVDNLNQEHIVFRSSDFTDISNASADEIASAYNRQAKYSFAISFYDSVTKHTYIRIFTNTIGAQGSMVVLGGLANIGLEPNGFLYDLGTGINTQWVVTKIGNAVTFTYNAGQEAGVESLLPGDIFFCDLPGNQGSFEIIDVDINARNFTFTNLLGTAGTITQTSSKQTKWLRPVYITSFGVRRRALAWETTTGVTSIEMPATPSIVYREEKGGFHINGQFGIVTEINSPTSLTVDDSFDMPSSGMFIIEPIQAITARLKGGLAEKIAVTNSNGRVISNFTRYSYSGITGNTLTGISPELPATTALDEQTISSLSRTGGIITALVANDFNVGDTVFIDGSTGIPILSTTGTLTAGSATITGIGATTGVSPGQLVYGVGIPSGSKVLYLINATTVTISNSATTTGSASITFSEDVNGPFEILSRSGTQFTVEQLGTNGTASVAGRVSKEQLLLAPDNFKIIVTTSLSSDVTKIKGPYVWDLNAPFTLSADTTTSTTEIVAGKTYKLLTVGSNNIPDGPGYIVINYGQNNQEGPIRYLYKAAEDILAIDTSYTFQKFHDAGSSIVAVSKLGAHIPTGLGREYSPYVTNPPDARILLQDLIKSVASAGIFIDFIIRYPNQLYGTINVYD